MGDVFTLLAARTYVAQVRWHYAKTMPQWPHEYIVRRIDDFLSFEVRGARVRLGLAGVCGANWSHDGHERRGTTRNGS